MRKLLLIILILITIIFFIPAIVRYNFRENNMSGLDPVEVNELLQELAAHWDSKNYILPEYSFDYSVIDNNENLLYKIGKGEVSETIVEATRNRDTIRDIIVDDKVVGKVLIYNNSEDIEIRVERKLFKNYMISVIIVFALVLFTLFLVDVRILKPFDKMKSFAESVASGDLDKPLEMDRNHIFGAFTESFDIMREELKNSRERELAANTSKKELIAQLSHDIKTPVASIKAMSEVLSAKEERDSVKDKLNAIGGKADQIDGLISNLFVSTLEELEKLEVHEKEMLSTDIEKIVREADHSSKIREMDIQECMVLADKLRLSQVVSNIIYNSYKYANTEIYVKSYIDMDYLFISFTDRGGGIPTEELNLITQKYKRGSNAAGKQGAGLGLYISKEIMENMQGSLEVTNADGGFRVTVGFRLA